MLTKKILVVGRGLVGSAFKGDDRFVLKGHDEWWLHLNEVGVKPNTYRAFVCTAGIVGQSNCKQHTMDEVMDANVQMPCEMAEMAHRRGIPFITYSTAGVYKDTSKLAVESDDTEPYNRYVASKIAMEHALLHFAEPIIFRIPWVDLQSDHPRDYGQKVKSWAQCEDVYTSYVHKDEIVDSVINAVENDVEPGVYNIASYITKQPDYIKCRYGWQGEVVPRGSMPGFTPAAKLCTIKAQEAGLI